MNIILMGAQGSGKGTQAAIIGPRLNLEMVATGELFRTEIAQGSELGERVESILERGDLVPDELTVAIVKQRLDGIEQRIGEGALNGALFDGFPRTTAQAEALETLLAGYDDQVDAVIELQVPRDELIERLSERRVCPECNAVYHQSADPPREQGTCDNEGATLVQREDDTPEAIRRRLTIYDEQTAPLVSFYDQRGVLYRVDGNQEIEQVTAAILDVIPGQEG